MPKSYQPGSSLADQFNTNIPQHLKISSELGKKVSKAAGAATDAYARHGLQMEIAHQGLLTQASPLDNWESSFNRNAAITPSTVISQAHAAASRAESRANEAAASEKTVIGKITRYLSGPKEIVESSNFENKFLRITVWVIGYFIFYILPTLFVAPLVAISQFIWQLLY